MVTFYDFAWLVFTDAFLMAGAAFGELYILQACKIVAGTVTCEVWHCPCHSIVDCILVL